MNESINELWKADEQSRKSLLRWFFFFGFCLAFVFVFIASWVTQPLFSKKEFVKAITVEPSKLKEHVEKLSVDFYPRNHVNVEMLNRSAEYIKAEFSSTKCEISEQEVRVNNLSYRNIICKFGSKSGKTIVVGAHYDSAFDTLGADDNASGVAGLIELAKLIDRESVNVPIELVAFTLEEPPFFATEKMGSYLHAKLAAEAKQEIDLMISLEMIGYFSDEANSQKYPFPLMNFLYPTTGNFVLIAGALANFRDVRDLKYEMSGNELDVFSANLPADLGGSGLSDHRNYWEFGFDAVMVTDTAFFRNWNYHTKTDTFEKLDYSRMAKIVEGVYSFLKSKRAD